MSHKLVLYMINRFMFMLDLPSIIPLLHLSLSSIVDIDYRFYCRMRIHYALEELSLETKNGYLCWG